MGVNVANTHLFNRVDLPSGGVFRFYAHAQPSGSLDEFAVDWEDNGNTKTEVLSSSELADLKAAGTESDFIDELDSAVSWWSSVPTGDHSKIYECGDDLLKGDASRVRYHFANKSVDSTHTLTAGETADLETEAAAADQTAFLNVLSNAVPWWSSVPTGDRVGFYTCGLTLWG